MLYRNLKATIYADCIQLNKDVLLYGESKKDTCLSIQTLKNQNVLFVPKQSCSVCYDEIYEVLLYAKDSLSYDIVTLTEKEKFNEVRNMIRDLGFKSEVYYFEDSFWQSISIQYAPFFSHIDNSLQCCHCFIPLVNYPEYSYLYLRSTLEKYGINIKKE